MSRKVVISKTAEKKLDKLFDYLTEHWSLKVKNEFIEKLEASLKIIQSQPETFPESKKGKGVRKCVLTRQTTLFYRFTSKRINIITVFDTRQNPEKLNSRSLTTPSQSTINLKTAKSFI